MIGHLINESVIDSLNELLINELRHASELIIDPTLTQ